MAARRPTHERMLRYPFEQLRQGPAVESTFLQPAHAAGCIVFTANDRGDFVFEVGHLCNLATQHGTADWVDRHLSTPRFFAWPWLFSWLHLAGFPAARSPKGLNCNHPARTSARQIE